MALGLAEGEGWCSWWKTAIVRKTPMAVTTGAIRSRPPLRQAMVERPIIALPPW